MIKLGFVAHNHCLVTARGSGETSRIRIDGDMYERRAVTILSTDMVGYSRMMARAPDATVARGTLL